MSISKPMRIQQPTSNILASAGNCEESTGCLDYDSKGGKPLAREAQRGAEKYCVIQTACWLFAISRRYQYIGLWLLNPHPLAIADWGHNSRNWSVWKLSTAGDIKLSVDNWTLIAESASVCQEGANRCTGRGEGIANTLLKQISGCPVIDTVRKSINYPNY